MAASVSFEVMGYKDGHWSILFITADHEEAVSEAKNAEAGKHIQAVKVIKQSIDAETGDERSKTIYNGASEEVAAHAHKAKAAPKGHGESKVKSGQVEGKSKLHPELVTDFIDRIKMSIIVIGVVVLTLFILAFAYLANPDVVSGFIDSLLK